ncbi:UDP-glucose--hexose-1-phosphate uridylyltransferase [Candidatus Viridilinea mediisalina]|uniref:Galactose-1-phosphate uridylyltransferase n=1 Tax=Candidatus Viridilinea mediisalina TaxID=2024553 RepID=A0A2A6RE84_9CHLR|nr:UDP-glucose--hexose-1-phosphate uridylyltransferase [Candidatus Viridilinea mediisalina]PDW00620.1 galactose-1-phosphate uridylyltransferase [Candidatus Viridilinea mediisalina]
MLQHPHRRYNPLIDQWIVVSPQRMQRPWLGQEEPASAEERPAYDPHCFLCPGNLRADGQRTPAYNGVWVFDNDYAALLPAPPQGEVAERASPDAPPLMVAHSERGICRVICYTPRHDLHLGQLEPAALLAVVEAWSEQYTSLGALDWVRYVLPFENRGAMMGASNPHPHGQLWATGFLPGEVVREDASQRRYLHSTGRTLLSDYLAMELQRQERIVCANEHMVALVPFWAAWPFETLLLPRRPVAALPALYPDERAALAALLKQLISCYDRLFNVSFPYSMGWHQAPTDGEANPHWHMHAHFLPPLLRSATVRKFMVGYELLGEPQRDLTPEEAARRLREAR